LPKRKRELLSWRPKRPGDFAKALPQPGVLTPLQGSYRSWDVYTPPPPFGGWVVLQALEILDGARAEQLAPVSPNRVVWLLLGN